MNIFFLPAQTRKFKRPSNELISDLPGITYRRLDDQDWTLEYISENCEKLTGYKALELTGENSTSYKQLIHHEDIGKIQDSIRAA